MEKEERLEYKVFTRIGKTKFEELSSLLNESDNRTMSALLRRILNREKIVVNMHDNSLDKVMEELSGIRKELQAIGININQVTRKIHLAIFDGDQLATALEALEKFEHLKQLMDRVFALISQLSGKWLPG